MLDQLSVADFEPLLRSELRFRAANGEFTLQLEEAALLQQPSPRPTAPFKLMFRSPEKRTLPQGTFELQHPVHGPIALFMVPLQPDAEGPSFEVIFN